MTWISRIARYPHALALLAVSMGTALPLCRCWQILDEVDGAAAADRADRRAACRDVVPCFLLTQSLNESQSAFAYTACLTDLSICQGKGVPAW